MWAAMKALATFTVDDLRLATGIGERTAKSYVKRLAVAGHLAAVEPGKPWHPGRWRLLASKNTGPRAPGIRHHRKLSRGADQAQRVFDFNVPALTPAAGKAPRRRQGAESRPMPHAERARPVDREAAEPTNVVSLERYRKPKPEPAAPAVGADQAERALAHKRKWVGRALRIVDIAQAEDRQVTWRRAARRDGKPD
jgi:hypothetical protein